MADPVYTVSVEAAVGSLTNVSSDVLRFTFDRTLSRLGEPLRADHLMIELANAAGIYAPKRGGAIGAGLLPGRLVSITATYAGSSYPLFYGRILRTQTHPRIGDNQSTVIEALSDADRLSRVNLVSSLFQNINASSLFTVLMSASNVASFSSDVLYDTVQYAYYHGVSVLSAIQELVDSGNYQIFIDGAGVVRLKSRYAGVFSSPVDSVFEFSDLTYSLDPDRVVNQIRLNATPKVQATNVNTLAYIAQQITVPAGDAVGFWLTFQDPEAGNQLTPVGSFITPVASTDYYAAVNSDGTGTDLTSTLSLNFARFAATIVCSIFNSGTADAHLARFQLRGYPVRGLAQLGFRYDASSSQSAYGLKAVEVANALIQDYVYLRDLAQTIVEDRKNPQDAVTVVRVNDFPQVLANQVGDVMTVINSVTGVNSNWSISRMSHEVVFSGGLRHQASYDLEYFQDKPWLVLDHATYGKLDSGRMLAL